MTSFIICCILFVIVCFLIITFLFFKELTDD